MKINKEKTMTTYPPMEEGQKVLSGPIGRIVERLRNGKETRIAIQKDGRLSAVAWELLATCLAAADITLPLETERNARGRKLIVAPVALPNLKIILVRQADIPWYVASGNADFGVAGEDCAIEAGVEELVSERLGGAESKLVVQVAESSNITRIEDLNGKSVATSYPRSFIEYCARNGVAPRNIIRLSGSVEAAIGIGAVDAVVDLVESGETMRANGLKPLAEVRRFGAALLENGIARKTLKSEEIPSPFFAPIPESALQQ